MATSGGTILQCLHTVYKCGYTGVFPGVFSQVRHYAARKGTREKAKKKKVKVEIKKLTFAEKVKLSKKIKIVKPDILLYSDNMKAEPLDDIYFEKYFKHRTYSFAEAIQCHREYLHPTMYDAPESIVDILVELNMQGIKKTRIVEPFNKIVSMKHKFDHGQQRNILVFCKAEGDVKIALDEGAALAGGSDIIDHILSGEISLHNYDTVIAHPSMMPEVLTLRGLLKKKHPNIKAGTLGLNLKEMIYTHLNGIKYRANSYDDYPAYGHTTISIGKLNMEIEHLEDNMKCAIDSIMSAKPRRPGSFITMIRVSCPPSSETLKIDQKLYIKDEENITEPVDDEEQEEDDNAAVAVPI